MYNIVDGTPCHLHHLDVVRRVHTWRLLLPPTNHAIHAARAVASMSEGQGFALHPQAATDITDIWEFIAEANPLAARRAHEDILAAIRALVPFPHQGHRRPDLTSRPLRFTTVRDYLIAYASDEHS